MYTTERFIYLLIKNQRLRNVHGKEDSKSVEQYIFSKRGYVQKLFCENEFYLHENKISIFISINFAFSFALKQGLEETQKWPNFRHV